MSKKKSLTLNFPIPREVVLNANQHKHHLVKGYCVRVLREMACHSANEVTSLTFSKFTVDVFVCPPSKRRIDPPNLYPTVKALIDGLTDANLWEDDDHTHMESILFKYGGLSGLNDSFVIKMEIRGDLK